MSGMDESVDLTKTLTYYHAEIIDTLANPDEVVDVLLEMDVFDFDMARAIYAEHEREKKTTKMLDVLYYKGENAVRCLHDAFVDTKNADLAKLLSPYVLRMEGNKNLTSPKEWPPACEEQTKMEQDNVIQITNNNFIYDYKSDEVYQMKNKVHGKAFIINNKVFEPSELLERKGSEIDAKNLKKLFRELQFEVVIGNDLSAQEMITFLQEERHKVNWDEMECVILVIMSHGNITGICGHDGALTPLQKLTEVFDSDNCPGLREKPRLVFVQACRSPENEEKTVTKDSQKNLKSEAKGDELLENKSGNDEQGLEDLGLNASDDLCAAQKKNQNIPRNVHPDADFLIAYATPEGSKAYRHVESGSWFLNAVVWTFKYHAHYMNINDLMTKVNRLVSMGKTKKDDVTVSECINRLRRRFCFFPGVYGDPPKFFSN